MSNHINWRKCLWEWNNGKIVVFICKIKNKCLFIDDDFGSNNVMFIITLKINKNIISIF